MPFLCRFVTYPSTKKLPSATQLTVGAQPQTSPPPTCPPPLPPPHMTCTIRFSFQLFLPNVLESDKVEFCVKFSCDGTDYWDNNDEKNYTVLSFRSKNMHNVPNSRRDEAYRLSMENHSEFAYWNVPSAGDDSPYWWLDDWHRTGDWTIDTVLVIGRLTPDWWSSAPLSLD